LDSQPLHGENRKPQKMRPRKNLRTGFFLGLSGLDWADASALTTPLFFGRRAAGRPGDVYRKDEIGQLLGWS
jgi:hypothetical protein